MVICSQDMVICNPFKKTVKKQVSQLGVFNFRMLHTQYFRIFKRLFTNYFVNKKNYTCNKNFMVIFV